MHAHRTAVFQRQHQRILAFVVFGLRRFHARCRRRASIIWKGLEARGRYRHRERRQHDTPHRNQRYEEASHIAGDTGGRRRFPSRAGMRRRDSAGMRRRDSGCDDLASRVPCIVSVETIHYADAARSHPRRRPSGVNQNATVRPSRRITRKSRSRSCRPAGSRMRRTPPAPFTESCQTASEPGEGTAGICVRRAEARASSSVPNPMELIMKFAAICPMIGSNAGNLSARPVSAPPGTKDDSSARPPTRSEIALSAAFRKLAYVEPPARRRPLRERKPCPRAPNDPPRTGANQRSPRMNPKATGSVPPATPPRKIPPS